MTRSTEILARLIGFETVSAYSNLDMIGFVESFLAGLGFAVTRIPDDSGRKAGIYAEVGPSGRGVLLSGHSDVVPVEGQSWTKPPFRMTPEGDRLFGRGATDMKGYLASVLSLAERAAKADLKEPLKIVVSYDEEVGCVGIREMLDRLAKLIGEPRACFVGEPTEMQVAIGHKGKAALRAVCHGQSGHSALAPHYVSALHLAVDFVAELRTLQAELERGGAHDPAYDLPYSTVHVGKLAAGRALNIVPDRAVVDFEFRHLAADPADGILARISEIAARIAARYRESFADAAIAVEHVNAYPGIDLPADAAVVGYARRLSGGAEPIKVAFGTEAGYFQRIGIPTVVCGPGFMEGQGHKPDEFITQTQLRACDDMMKRLLEDLVAASFPGLGGS